MRNAHHGPCYRCGEAVQAGDGHFERFGYGWRLQHAACAIKYRGVPDPARMALRLGILRREAAMTGKRAQRARQKLRELEPVYDPKDF